MHSTPCNIIFDTAHYLRCPVSSKFLPEQNLSETCFLPVSTIFPVIMLRNISQRCRVSQMYLLIFSSQCLAPYVFSSLCRCEEQYQKWTRDGPSIWTRHGYMPNLKISLQLLYRTKKLNSKVTRQNLRQMKEECTYCLVWVEKYLKCTEDKSMKNRTSQNHC